MMWMPKSARELEDIVEQGDLQETSGLDFKREIAKNSTSIAIDIAAMANDGGVICFGVEEDEDGRPLKARPFLLKGQADRLASIARTCISEPPEIEVREFHCPDDPSLGYLLLCVPASTRAPHMVVVKNENRFYGRCGATNAPLTEGEIARLYERRQNWEFDRDERLQKIIEMAPKVEREETGCIHFFAQPLHHSQDLVCRGARETAETEYLTSLVKRCTSLEVYPSSFAPDFIVRSPRSAPDGWVFYFGEEQSSKSRDPRYTLDLWVGFDGSIRLFCGRGADSPSLEPTTPVIMDTVIAGLVVRALFLAGQISQLAGNSGPVDAGVAVTRIEGLHSHTACQNIWYSAASGYVDSDYRQTARILSSTLVDDPRAAARKLLARFFRVTCPSQEDPLKT